MKSGMTVIGGGDAKIKSIKTCEKFGSFSSISNNHYIGSKLIVLSFSHIALTDILKI